MSQGQWTAAEQDLRPSCRNPLHSQPQARDTVCTWRCHQPYRHPGGKTKHQVSPNLDPKPHPSPGIACPGFTSKPTLEFSIQWFEKAFPDSLQTEPPGGDLVLFRGSGPPSLAVPLEEGVCLRRKPKVEIPEVS